MSAAVAAEKQISGFEKCNSCPTLLCVQDFSENPFISFLSVFSFSLTTSLCLYHSLIRTLFCSLSQSLIWGIFFFVVCKTVSFPVFSSPSIFFMLINEVMGVLNCCCLKAESCHVGFSALQQDSDYMSCTYYPPTHTHRHTHAHMVTHLVCSISLS